MKIRMPKRPLSGSSPAVATLSHFCERLDRTVPQLRTLLLIAGVLAAALQKGTVADYLFGAGLLLHWAIWFQRWWTNADWRH